MLVYTSDLFLDHELFGHPECPTRLTAVLQTIRADEQLLQSVQMIEPRDATVEELTRVHTPSHVELIADVAEAGGAMLDADTYISSGSFGAAVRAAGAVIQACEGVLEEGDSPANRAMCLVRPPGHHARPGMPMGFCLFNNVALGAAAAMASCGVSRILVVDFDVHHGNGIQEAFYEDPRVFYFSTHEYPFYPGTGSAKERGRKEGKGYTLNVPLAAGTGHDEFLERFNEGLELAASRLEPQLILVCAGFDGHRDDPLALLRLEARTYAEATRSIGRLAERLGSVPIVSALEGGYDLPALSQCVCAHLRALIGTE